MKPGSLVIFEPEYDLIAPDYIINPKVPHKNVVYTVKEINLNFLNDEYICIEEMILGWNSVYNNEAGIHIKHWREVTTPPDMEEQIQAALSAPVPEVVEY